MNTKQISNDFSKNNQYYDESIIVGGKAIKTTVYRLDTNSGTSNTDNSKTNNNMATINQDLSNATERY